VHEGIEKHAVNTPKNRSRDHCGAEGREEEEEEEEEETSGLPSTTLAGAL